jgi:serine/threonine protein kinase/Flp pilus assembly protein TadD
MEHADWQPEWKALEEDFDPADRVESSFEAARALDFRFDSPSLGTSDVDQTVTLRRDETGRLVPDFGLAHFETPGQRTLSKPRAMRRPEIPGYEILGELGRGAMGVVYRARQLRLNREVALKMILAGDHASADTLARFTAEAETIAKIRHPHIVQIYAISDWEGRPYVELEYVEGGSLGSRLDGTPWPPRSAARLLESLARAAAEAHRQGIVHRDLKPANILMTSTGEPKISDFGLAKTLEEDSGLTRTESILGSPNYMAPEQADGRAKEVGRSADIYALGANLYELLTGRPPFVAPTVLATLDLVKNADPVPPRRLQPLLDRDLETICLKCLEKEPEKRYDTADNLADDLAAYLANEPIQAMRSAHWERVLKWVKRRPSTAALILVSVMALLAGLAVLDWRQREVARISAISRKNLENLRNQVDRCVLLGRESIRRQEWESAQTQMSTALTLLRSEPRLASSQEIVQRMFNQCSERISEQAARESARRRFVEFQKLYDEAIFYQSDYTGLESEANIRASRSSAAEALSKFDRQPGQSKSLRSVLEPSPHHFDARELEKINVSCYELSLLLAESVSRSLPGEDPLRQDRRALEILESVRNRGLITPAFHLRRASALDRAGDASGADLERKLAEEFPVTQWSAVDHFLTGEQAFQRKDLKRAIDSFRHALAIQPDRFWAHYFLAVCLLKDHRPAEAQSALIACQSRRPGFAWTYLLKGFAEGEMGEFELAEEDFRRANLLPLNDQERYVMLVNRGVMRIRRGRNEDAIVDLTAAIALKPDQFEAFINLAMGYKNLGHWDQALETLGQALAVHPMQAVLYRARSQIYRLRGQTNPALNDLKKVIELMPTDDPESVADHLEIALLLQQDGRPEESLDAIDEALRLKPNRAESHRLRGVTLMMLRRYDEAIRSFNICLAGGDASASIYEARGLALASRGSYDRALADYTMALSLGKPTSSLLANRGWVYLLSGASTPALRDFDEALKLDPSNSHALSGRGLTNVQIHRTREAVEDANASIRLSPDDSRQIYNAARVYCQAAAKLESSPDRNPVMLARAERYRVETMRLLERAIELCPAGDRSRFWNEFVRKDNSFDLIKRSRSFLALGAQAAPRRSSMVSGREGSDQ